MASYVADASVIIEYLITGPFTRNARALFTQMASSDRLIVPEFCLLECTNVLWKHVRFQGMAVPQAEALLTHLRKLPLMRVAAKAAGLPGSPGRRMAHRLYLSMSAIERFS